ncbi:MAG: NUDIX domain-containing protein [Desulfuromonadales bacterium]|nr:NUDIX domain-containing protein [Desulfuromonadales bacterium]
MPKRIKTSVVACIIDHDDRVLLTRRGVPPFHGLWIMPGGKIEHGETILAALHREVQEEVGIEIMATGLIDVYEHVANADNPDHFVILYYRASPLSFDLRPDGIECSEAIWCTAAALPDYDLAPGTGYILRKIFPLLPWPELTAAAGSCSIEEPLACLPDEVK